MRSKYSASHESRENSSGNTSSSYCRVSGFFFRKLFLILLIGCAFTMVYVSYPSSLVVVPNVISIHLNEITDINKISSDTQQLQSPNQQLKQAKGKNYNVQKIARSNDNDKEIEPKALNANYYANQVQNQNVFQNRNQNSNRNEEDILSQNGDDILNQNGYKSANQNGDNILNLNKEKSVNEDEIQNPFLQYEDANENEIEEENEVEQTDETIETEFDDKEMACHLPTLNPFDPSILQYVRSPHPVQCQRNPKYPLLFKTDLRSTLIQVNKPENYGYYFCCYGSFKRKKGFEFKVVFSKRCIPIKEKKTIIPEDVDFIQISCTKGPSIQGPRKVIDLFGFVHLKKSVEDRVKSWNLKDRIQNQRQRDDGDSENYIEKTTKNLDEAQTGNRRQKPPVRKVNVVILGLDAVSQMNFIRTMPLSYEYLTKNLSALGLSGYTKVGDNTFPNIVPATTGLSVRELRRQCWNRKSDYFDNCPFIWKDYSSQGYTTAYGEDAVWMGIFNYQKRGFKIEPTDYYYSTLTLQQDRKISHQMGINARICYGPRLGFEVLLDYLKRMAVTMNKDRRYFQFIWATSLFHDYLNDGKLGDQSLLEMLKWFKQEGYLDDTVFVLMSDHGIRWGGIRSTLQGKLEERMPFLYFVFPQWFKEEYRVAIENLIGNNKRLTTPFDLYETFKDLLYLKNINDDKILERLSSMMDQDQNQDQNQNQDEENLPRGISLFLPIPLKRTCEDAGISDHWCVCQRTESVALENNSLVYEAALNVVEFINELLAKSPQCLVLELEEVLNAQVYTFKIRKSSDDLRTIISSSDPRLSKHKVTLSLSLLVAPSNATFEATVTRLTNGRWVTSGEISRTNLYGDQSRCVEDYDLKKFCYCG